MRLVPTAPTDMAAAAATTAEQAEGGAIAMRMGVARTTSETTSYHYRPADVCRLPSAVYRLPSTAYRECCARGST